jgi:hypothetical protein
MNLLIYLLALSVPESAADYKIRQNGDKPRYEIVHQQTVITSYADIRQAKAFRNALASAMSDGMRPAIAVLYAQERAKDELTARLETDEPDEHFIAV